MSRSNLFNVSIFDNVKRIWRTTYVTTMSDCVRLVTGLATNWSIELIGENRPWLEMIGYDRHKNTDFGDAELFRKFKHALRAMACRIGLSAGEYACDDMHMFHVVQHRR